MDHKQYYLQVKKKKEKFKQELSSKKQKLWNSQEVSTYCTYHSLQSPWKRLCNLTNPYTNTAFLFALPKNYDYCSWFFTSQYLLIFSYRNCMKILKVKLQTSLFHKTVHPLSSLKVLNFSAFIRTAEQSVLGRGKFENKKQARSPS